jgi:hypothetical protein
MDNVVAAPVSQLRLAAGDIRSYGAFLGGPWRVPDRHEEGRNQGLAARNIRLAVVLGLLALAIYAGYIFTYI